MHHLQRISWVVTIVGAVMIAVALLASLDPLWLLSGLLLAWAGGVKIIITLVWTRVAHMGTDEHQPTHSP